VITDLSLAQDNKMFDLLRKIFYFRTNFEKKYQSVRRVLFCHTKAPQCILKITDLCMVFNHSGRSYFARQW